MSATETISHKIVLLLDQISPAAKHAGLPFWGYEQDFIGRKFLRAGISMERVDILKLSETTADDLNKSNATLIVAMGEKSLQFCTGRKNIDKQQLSVLPTIEGLKQKKCIPTFPLRSIWKQFSLQVYLEMALRKANKESAFPEFISTPERFHTNPDFDLTMDILAECLKKDELAIDLETGANQINTFGVAWSESDALAANILPERLEEIKYKQLLERIADVCESPAKKIFQNGPYDITYLSRYGIAVENYHHDTMWCQKFLWPELEMGLDNVGRIYTNKPFWKDDGKGESDKKDWTRIRDWAKHYLYSCRDTTGTFEAKQAQVVDLKSRGLDSLFYNYLMKLGPPIIEMCTEGLLINPQTQLKLREEATEKLNQLTRDIRQEFGDVTINPRSNRQIKVALKGMGYQLPRKRNAKGDANESTDAKSLKKMRLKHPNDKIFNLLLKFAELQKSKSSYLDINYDFDNKVRYLLNAHGTETGRFSGKKCAIGNGFNPQTIPSEVKCMFESPQGYQFLEVDLSQAESRFVAYDSACLNLISMLEDPTKDLHKYVASAIYKTPEALITHDQRQLGKKSGHGANYDMHEKTFMESCLKEMDLVISLKEAHHILTTYHTLFPELRDWHRAIRTEVQRYGKLYNPIGRVRHFYGRLTDDDTFREAYAYRPQSTIPDVTNHLLLCSISKRTEGLIDFKSLLQIHDSLLYLVPDASVDFLARLCKDTSKWHPKIELKAGRLIIPTSVKVGTNWGDMKKWT